MRLVLVGDPHIRATDLDEGWRLMRYAQKVALENHARILILGDLHHYHGIIYAVVLDFWHQVFRSVGSVDGQPGIIAMVGNHDLTGVEGSRVHSLVAHSPNDVQVISQPTVVEGVLVVPYMGHDELVAAASVSPGLETLICHATFDGSNYENGIYAKGGLDPNLIPQRQIVSGHIHGPQEFGKVWYPGAPRALTVSDANSERSIWLVEFDRGRLVSRKAFSLNDVCRQVFHFEDTPTTPIEVNFDSRHKYHVDIKGPADWIAQRKPIFDGKAQVRTFRTDKPVAKLKESEGVSVALSKYVKAFKPQFGTETVVLEQMLKERGGVSV